MVRASLDVSLSTLSLTSAPKGLQNKGTVLLAKSLNNTECNSRGYKSLRASWTSIWMSSLGGVFAWTDGAGCLIFAWMDRRRTVIARGSIKHGWRCCSECIEHGQRWTAMLFKVLSLISMDGHRLHLNS